MRLFVRQGDKKEKNGYPFTTFTDSSDFLGIILGVLSDDLATMLISITDFYRFFGLSWVRMMHGLVEFGCTNV